MSGTDGHFRFRIPDAEKAFIVKEAKKNMRSITSEIVFTIRARMVKTGGEADGLANQLRHRDPNPALEAPVSFHQGLGEPK